MSIGNAGYAKRRAPTVAGIFYPDEPKETEATLAAYENRVEDAADKRKNLAFALVAPHAGWDLSGKVVSDAFRAAGGRKISTVVVIGPLHEVAMEGIFLTESEFFETPLGDITVDRELCAELESCGTHFVVNDIPHLEEHSIEILLPFIRRRFPSASIVPILTGGARGSVVRTLARGLDLVFEPIAESTLFVVSTNLCANVETKKAHAHSDRFLDCLERGDSPGVMDGIASGTISACGAAGCAALMETRMLGERKPVTISRADSSEQPDHDAKKLVKYAALAYY